MHVNKNVKLFDRIEWFFSKAADVPVSPVNSCVCVFDQVMLELAQLYLTLDDVEACQQQCSAILRNDPVNESATLVSFLKQMLLSQNLTPMDQSDQSGGGKNILIVLEGKFSFIFSIEIYLNSSI